MVQAGDLELRALGASRLTGGEVLIVYMLVWFAKRALAQAEHSLAEYTHTRYI